VEKPYLNIAGYRFFRIEDPDSLRYPLRDFCRELGLKGTILLSHEGINSYLSGLPEAIQQYRDHIREELGFPEMDYKEIWSANHPYTRMLVKVKKEIIKLGDPDIQPEKFTAPYLSAQEFKQWLDEGRDMVILDTRNDFEINLGKFSSAIDLGIHAFLEFPEKIKDLPEDMKNKPVVTYCTGGIRCEKASPLLLQKHGFKEVYQLEGGILKYFEECGAAHYEGECFVFDHRIGLNSNLEETETTQCNQCRTALTSEALKENPQMCPHCFSEL
jgi:UPF0176 protein